MNFNDANQELVPTYLNQVDKLLWKFNVEWPWVTHGAKQPRLISIIELVVFKLLSPRAIMTRAFRQSPINA